MNITKIVIFELFNQPIYLND